MKLFLAGAYNSATISMSTNLTANAILPLTQPYNTAPWNYTGMESVSTMPINVVDWILIEVRDPANNYTVLDTRAALLLEDGNVQGIDGNAGVDFYNINDGQNYYISVKHRNHLGVMSAVSVSLPNILA